MHQTTSSSRKAYFDEAMLARLRIASGLILFFYILLHFVNHAAGLISLEAMSTGGKILKPFWRSWPMTVLLYGALAVHFILVFWRIYTRRSFRLTVSEWVQLILGICIPVLLVVHVMGTRYAASAYGINDTYAYVLISTMVFTPSYAWFNTFGLLAAWIHSCIGLHMWLRTKANYKAWHYETGLVLAAIVPTAALAGYWVAGERIVPLAVDGEYMEKYYQRLNLKSDEVWGFLADDIYVARALLLTNLASVVLFRVGRWAYLRRSAEVKISYAEGPTTSQAVGASLLEMSKLADIPHASICGGRGRCSTCRVRILESKGKLPPPSDAEKKVLSRVRAADDVRLACQLYPTADMKVVRLLPFDGTATSGKYISPYSSGQEKQVTILFADLRDFTRTAETRLPYDVVYLINQFSQIMGEVVEKNCGRIDKFLGDGFMALFGLESEPEKGAADAVAACAAMVDALNSLNDQLVSDLDEPLRIGIGVHTGAVILGDMGYGNSRSLTALGDPVNIASRLEQETKVQKKTICISSQTLSLANLKAPTRNSKTVSVRGRTGKIDIHAINDMNTLTPLLRG